MYRFTSEGLEALEGTGSNNSLLMQSKPRLHYLYDLAGVTVHSGTAFAGHYYSYIKERPKETTVSVRGGWAPLYRSHTLTIIDSCTI